MDNKEICAMMYSMQILQNRGISLQETMETCLSQMLLCYEFSKDIRYLESAELQLQAYVNMGNALDGNRTVTNKILTALGKTERDFRPDSCFGGKKIRLTFAQVRSVIGKWRSSKCNPMTVNQLVDDIINKVRKQETGNYFYKYQRYLDSEPGAADIYELIVSEDGSYFHDMTNFRFYKFVTEEKCREER